MKKTNANVSAKVFERFWGLTDVKIIKILQQRNDRIVGLIKSDTSEYVFKTAGSWKTLKGVTKDTKVFDILHKKDFYNAPQLVKTNKGRNFIKFRGTFLYLLQYINGRNPKPTPQTYKKLATITAKLHNIKKFPFETDFDPAKIIKDLCKNSTKYSFGQEYKNIAKSLPNFQKFPKTVIHTDIAPCNAIQTKNGDIIFVDWDDAGIGPTVLDLGSVLNEIIKEDTTFSKKNLHAFYQTYFNHKKITMEEKVHIFDGCLFFALMYITYGNIEKRWKRILWLVKNRKLIEKYYR